MAKLVIEIDDASALLAANRRVWNGMGDPVEFLQTGIANALLSDAKTQAVREAEQAAQVGIEQAKTNAAAAFDVAAVVTVGDAKTPVVGK